MKRITSESISFFQGKEYLLQLISLKEDSYEITIWTRGQAKHKAIYSKYDLLDSEGETIDTRMIDSGIARFIMDNFKDRGPTESFRIYESHINGGKFINTTKIKELNPGNIKHKKSQQERDFTATGEKLVYHWPIFKKLSETGYGSIIRATLTLHQVCASHCPFCSTIHRNKKDSITLEEAKNFVKNLYFEQADYNKTIFPQYNELYHQETNSDIRLRGLILSGGGQPNLWPYFEKFVEWLATLDIDLGLITNGFPRNIHDSIYEKFKWIRISITPADASPFYPDKKFENQYIPSCLTQSGSITTGLSYVYGPWTDDDSLIRLNTFAESHGFDYCRLLTDCNLPREAQLQTHKNLADRLIALNLMRPDGGQKSKIFHQLKYHAKKEEAEEIWPDGQCQLQAYNVFWDTTGHETNGASYCYPCDSVTVLAEANPDNKNSSAERRFNPLKWGTVLNTEVDKLYKFPLKSYFDPRINCTACLFSANNRMVRNLTKINSEVIKDKTNVEIKHVNFP